MGFTLLFIIHGYSYALEIITVSKTQFLFSCSVTHTTVLLVFHFLFSLLGFLICKSGDITFVTSFSQTTRKVNEMVCLSIGLLGNKMLHMHRISSLFISTLREHEVNFFFVFGLFRATPMAFGGSQARG